MAGLFDLFDMLFTNVLKCTTDDLDNFAGNASDAETERLGDIVFNCGSDENGLDKVASEEDIEWFFSVANRQPNEEA